MNLVFSIKGITNIATAFFGKSIHRSAAALSYFLTMTIFPALICIQWLLGTLGEDIINFLEDFSELIPENALMIIEDYLSYTGSQSTGLLSVGIVTAIYTGSSAYRMLSDLLRSIFDSRGGNAVVRFIMSFIWASAFLVFIYISAIIILAGRWLIGFLEPFFAKIEFIDLADLANLWEWFRFILLIVFSTFVLYVLYLTSQWYSPYETVALPGAVFASLLLTVASLIFSWFISLSVNYSLIYGSLASMIILMFWLYVLGNIIIIGALINKEISVQKDDPKIKYHDSITKFIKSDD